MYNTISYIHIYTNSLFIHNVYHTQHNVLHTQRISKPHHSKYTTTQLYISYIYTNNTISHFIYNIQKNSHFIHNQ